MFFCLSCDRMYIHTIYIQVCRVVLNNCSFESVCVQSCKWCVLTHVFLHSWVGFFLLLIFVYRMCNTVEPLIMDTLRRVDNLPTMDKLFTPCPQIVHIFLTRKKGQPLNNIWTKCSSPTCPLFRASTVYVWCIFLLPLSALPPSLPSPLPPSAPPSLPPSLPLPPPPPSLSAPPPPPLLAVPP